MESAKYPLIFTLMLAASGLLAQSACSSSTSTTQHTPGPPISTTNDMGDYRILSAAYVNELDARDAIGRIVDDGNPLVGVGLYRALALHGSLSSRLVGSLALSDAVEKEFRSKASANLKACEASAGIQLADTQKDSFSINYTAALQPDMSLLTPASVASCCELGALRTECKGKRVIVHILKSRVARSVVLENSATANAGAACAIVPIAVEVDGKKNFGKAAEIASEGWNVVYTKPIEEVLRCDSEPRRCEAKSLGEHCVEASSDCSHCTKCVVPIQQSFTGTYDSGSLSLVSKTSWDGTCENMRPGPARLSSELKVEAPLSPAWAGWWSATIEWWITVSANATTLNAEGTFTPTDDDRRQWAESKKPVNITVGTDRRVSIGMSNVRCRRGDKAQPAACKVMPESRFTIESL